MKIVFYDSWHRAVLVFNRKSIYKIDYPEWLGRLFFRIFHGGTPEED